MCVLIDNDGSTVRFERWADELFFYIDGELSQRYVKILQIQKKKGWIIIRGLKIKSDQMFSQEVKTVVETRPQDKVRVLREIERIRYWHGPFCKNSVTYASAEDEFLVLKKYDARKGSWQCAFSTSSRQLNITEADVRLCFSILPHNCKIRQDTDLYRFIQTETMGAGLVANQDIQQKKILMKDRAILFANWHRGMPPHHMLIGDLFHSLLTNYPDVWAYITDNLCHGGEASLGQFAESAKKLCADLQQRQPIYKDDQFERKITLMLSVLFTNAFQFSFTNHDLLSCLFPIISIFNHSCNPNCHVEFAQNQTGFYGSVRALRPIKAGEALTISYFGTQQLDSLVDNRRDCIRQERHFICMCCRCVTESLDRSPSTKV